MIALVCFVLAVLASPFKSNSRLEAENAALRQQLIVLRRKVRGGPSLRTAIGSSSFSSIAGSHRSYGFSLSSTPRPWCAGIGPAFVAIGVGNRGGGGRPQITTELRALIGWMSTENLLWVRRIHGKLRTLGFSVAQSSVAKYMVKRRGPPSQGPFCVTTRRTSPPWSFL
jgi:hypothetical protein